MGQKVAVKGRATLNNPSRKKLESFKDEVEMGDASEQGETLQLGGQNMRYSQQLNDFKVEPSEKQKCED